jgi:hypothetical protein
MKHALALLDQEAQCEGEGSSDSFAKTQKEHF